MVLTLFRTFLVIVAVAFMSLTACASTEKHRSFGQVVDDAWISNSLKVKYFKDKGVKGTHLNIDTRKGVVSLRGKQDTQKQIDRAIELAERQKGVREVKSYLVLTGSPSLEEEKQATTSKRSRIEEKDLKENGKSSERAPSGKSEYDENDSSAGQRIKSGSSDSSSKPSKVFAD